jgi:hypothetical protein|tara:strand:+ start:1434 stop:2642 length:1209 start_codon:yes stop_codon:yes gene_type:complete
MELNKMKKTLLPLLRLTLLTILSVFKINAYAESIDWAISSPEIQGISQDKLLQLHQELKNGTHGYIDSFLVIKNNHLVFEKYYENDYDSLTKNRRSEQAKIMQINYGDKARPIYNYYNPEWHPFYKDSELHTIQSVSKSVTSALIGIAIEREEIPSIDKKISSYFPKYKAYFDDSLKQSISIRDLLTMTAGIKWDESSTAYTSPLNDAANMESSEDWLQYILALPMNTKPGENFVYNSGITVLLSHILYKATNMHIDEYAKKYLFGPLDISDFYWKKTPTGLIDAEGGLYLSSRDFAKIGYLYLQDGQWNNKQLLTKKWVKSTMLPDTHIPESTRKYGYQWWLVPNPNNENSWIYSGSGYGGQYLLVFPENQLVVVFTGWNIFDQARPSIESLSKRIINAIQ